MTEEPKWEWRDAADLSKVKWPFGGYAPGKYMGKCSICNDRIVDCDKRAYSCLACAIGTHTDRMNNLANELSKLRTVFGGLQDVVKAIEEAKELFNDL
ncbi:hypothetical protein EVB91_250 [Rhizobium phage RHph_I1_18]|nr:hypothetical protein EVB91_250 [Rhizobium phage RHph_I1_18]